MKILHLPIDIAGQIAFLTTALKKNGYTAIGINFSSSIINRHCDYNYEKTKASVFNPIYYYHLLLRVYLFLKYLNFDVFHFHYGRTLLPLNLDLWVLKILGKKIIFHFHGSDIRANLKTSKQSKTQKRKIQRAKKFADKIIVSTPDLLEWAPKGSVYLPVGISEESIKNIPKKTMVGDKINIIHSTTNRNVKGTNKIESVMTSIIKKFPQVTYQTLENIDHEKMLAIAQEADIRIDQLRLGWYGVSAVESMAMHKIVLCYIKDPLINIHPELPIININQDNIYKKIEETIKNFKTQSGDIGKKSREYYLKHHSSSAIIKKLNEIYNEEK